MYLLNFNSDFTGVQKKLNFQQNIIQKKYIDNSGIVILENKTQIKSRRCKTI